MHFNQSNRKHHPWVCQDTSTQRQIQPVRLTHPRRSWELPYFNMDNQCATLQGPLLRQYRKRDTESGVGAREIPLQYFIYRKLCTLYTKPLESNFKKKLTLCPPRLQRPLIRPLKYDIILKYVKGSEAPITDILSRVTPRLCMSTTLQGHSQRHLPNNTRCY